MIGVDSNVLLRHLLQDDPRQSPLASAFFEKRSSDDPAFIGRLVLAETVWVLTSTYGVGPEALGRTVRALLAASDIIVEGASSLRRALRDADEQNADLADAIIAHAAIDAGCDGIVTFDKRAQALPGMLPVG